MASIKIDSGKFQKQIAKLGLTYAEVARAIGYSSAFVSDAIRREVIAEPAALLLEAKFGIRREDIVPTKEIDLDHNPPAINNVTLDKLYAVIYDAVYHAMILANKKAKEDQNEQPETTP